MHVRQTPGHAVSASRYSLLGAAASAVLASAAIASPTIANAQVSTAGQVPAPAQPGSAQPPADAPPADATSGGLDEIVVTAQRRAENLQDVPISVTAINSAALESTGIASTLLLPQIVPSVQMVRSGPASIFYIRGVGNSSGGTGEEGANAFYVDGVYLADLTQANTNFNNIERVEVLKGPQGTLFGRNSSGGLINVITREPGRDLLVKGSVGYANYDTYKGQLYVASPITSTISADIALTGQDQKRGYGSNLVTGKHDNERGWYYGARSKVVWKPNDTTKIVFAGDYWKSKDNYGNGFTIAPGSYLVAPAGTPVNTPGAVIAPGGNLVFGYAGDYNRNTNNPATSTQRIFGVSMTATFDVGFGDITSITAFRDLKAEGNVDSDYGPPTIVELYIPSYDKTFQEEVRLASHSGGRFTWQAGMFFFRARAGVNNQYTFGTLVGGADRGQLTTSTMRTQSFAGFGEGTYDVTPTTHVTLGGRYTREDRSLNATQLPFNQTVPALITAFTFSRKDTITYGKFTYRAAIRQDITDHINVYASANRGFKSGLWSLQAPAGPSVKPQTTDAYEAGIKSELFDRLLRVNLAGYHYKIKDFQVRAGPTNSANPVLLNATAVKITGLEGEVQLAPARRLLFSANFNLLKSHYGDFPNAPFLYPNPAVCTPNGPTPGMTTGPATGGNKACLGNASGNRTPLSPKFTGSLGASYSIPTSENSQLSFNALFSHNSGYFFEQDNYLLQHSYNLLNASVEYSFTKNLSVQIYANNLTNKFYFLEKLASATASRGEAQAPRTFGADFKFEF